MTTPIKILLADDDEDDQLFFMDALKEISPNLQCTVAQNGMEVIKILEKEPPPPSVIFLDLNMPLMNGFECLEQLKKTKPYSEIPVVILTTSKNINDVNRSMKLGAEAFLTKASNFESIKNQLRSILQKSFAF